MESAIAVANYFLAKAKIVGKSMTPMQIVKLVYVAHGWHLGLTGKPLFVDDVQAWKYGPVVPSVYNAFKKYGSGPILEPGTEIKFDEGFNFGNLKASSVVPEVHDQQRRNLLDRIWDVYGSYDGITLSAMTHKTRTPWDIAYNDMGGKFQSGFPIPNELIRAYYKQKADASRPTDGN
jgi:uncharacterized phage-associated protein